MKKQKLNNKRKIPAPQAQAPARGATNAAGPQADDTREKDW